MNPEIIGTDVTGKPVRIHQDVVTQGTGILARRRKGKSQTAGCIFEGCLARGQSVVVLDPPEAHWGLRYCVAPSGLPSGPSPYAEKILAVQLYSGRHQQAAPRPGELQVDIRDAARLGEVIGESKFSAVIGFNALGPTELCHAGTALLQALYLRNKCTRLIAFEEAHNFMPERPAFKEHNAVLWAAKKVCTEGGQKGLGWVVISQRPQRVSKDILSQIDNMIVLGMVGPHEIASLKDWFEHNVTDQTMLTEIRKSLPKLHPGQAWLLSPEFLNVMVQFTARPRLTYHAGRTPRPGERAVNVKRFTVETAVREFEKLIGHRAEEAASLERANARIRELDAELARAKRELTHRPQIAVPAPPAAKVVASYPNIAPDVQAYLRDHEKWERTKEAARASTVQAITGYLEHLADKRKHDPPHLQQLRKVLAKGTVLVRTRLKPVPVSQKAHIVSPENADGLKLKGIHGLILQGLVRIASTDETAPTRARVAFYANGASVSGGAFRRAIGELRTVGFVDYPEPNSIGITEAGCAAIGRVAPATRKELLDAGKARLNTMQREIFEYLLEAGREVDRTELAEGLGKAAAGGGFRRSIGQMKTAGLIRYPKPQSLKLEDWILEVA